MCSFLVWKNACLNYREFDLEGDLVGVPHTWYLSAQSFIWLFKLVWREYDIVAMNEWKKKCVGLQRTWVSKRTVYTNILTNIYTNIFTNSVKDTEFTLWSHAIQLCLWSIFSCCRYNKCKIPSKQLTFRRDILPYARANQRQNWCRRIYAFHFKAP